MRRRQRGFTLVELMVVVAIIAILGALVVGLSGRTYGVNASTMSQQIAQTLNFARSRALSTRRIHRVIVHFDYVTAGNPVEIEVWQAGITGMNRNNIIDPDPMTPAPGDPQLVERIVVPISVTMFHGAIGYYPAGTPPGGFAQSTTQFDIDFLPNGSADAVGGSTGYDAATIYVTDGSNARQTRVVVYAATGSSYVRKSW
jgi:prepilin-type N-terminal cleavage/methylation domain-containing protein